MEKLNTEIRKAQIKKAVLKIISTEGLGKLSTRNLAEKVGFTEGALFRHFKSKRDIMLSIVDDVKKTLIHNQKIIAFGSYSAKNRLFQFLCGHVKYLVNNKGITFLLFSEAVYFNAAELKTVLSEILVLEQKYISKIVEDGIREGIWDSKIKVENFAMFYLGIPLALNVEMILNSSSFQEKYFCKNMICLLERILKKK